MDKSKKSILVTGASSGLGRYINSTTSGSDQYQRHTKTSSYEKVYDLIIHGIWAKQRSRRNRVINSQEEIYRRISDIRHKKLVFISSIDAAKVRNTYAQAKKKLNRWS